MGRGASARRVFDRRRTPEDDGLASGGAVPSVRSIDAGRFHPASGRSCAVEEISLDATRVVGRSDHVRGPGRGQERGSETGSETGSSALAPRDDDAFRIEPSNGSAPSSRGELAVGGVTATCGPGGDDPSVGEREVDRGVRAPRLRSVRRGVSRLAASPAQQGHGTHQRRSAASRALAREPSAPLARMLSSPGATATASTGFRWRS